MTLYQNEDPIGPLARELAALNKQYEEERNTNAKLLLILTGLGITAFQLRYAMDSADPIVGLRAAGFGL